MLIEREWEILQALILQESAPKTPVSWPFFSKTSFFWGEREPKSLISLKVAKKSCLFLSFFGPKSVKKRQNFRSYPPVLSFFVFF